MAKYRVKDGEYLSQIATRHGFLDGGARIWDVNPELQEKSHGNPDLLTPGWELEIPEPRVVEHTLSTNARHKLKLVNVPVKALLHLQDPSGAPAQGLSTSSAWQDGAPVKSTVSDRETGVIELADFDASSKSPVYLTVTQNDRELTLVIAVGQLDPISNAGELQFASIQKILQNLGYYWGTPSGHHDSKTRDALFRFQKAERICPSTGLADQATCTRLIKLSHPKQAQPAVPVAQPEDATWPPQDAEAQHQLETVTRLSKYLDPSDPNQSDSHTMRLRKVWNEIQTYTPTVHAVPATGDSSSATTVRATPRQFVFLDVGAWVGEAGRPKNTRKRNFGVIWGSHVYLCNWTSAAQLPKRSEHTSLAADSPLDKKFFNWLGNAADIMKWAHAPGESDEFDWGRLTVIIPDLHLLDAATSQEWRGGGYRFTAEKELLEFVATIAASPALVSVTQIVQIGDSYDLWVGKRCLFRKDSTEHRVLPIRTSGPTMRSTDPSDELAASHTPEPDWPREVLEEIKTWVDKIRAVSVPADGEHSPSELALAVVLDKLRGTLNPAVRALELAEMVFPEVIYIYGNHDNYLASPEVTDHLGLARRLRCKELPGVLIEHGHRMESRFADLGFADNNSDGVMGGYLNTLMAYLRRSRKSVKTWMMDNGLPKSRLGSSHSADEVQYDAKWVLGSNPYSWFMRLGDEHSLDEDIVSGEALQGIGASQQAQYWGEMAQTWMGRCGLLASNLPSPLLPQPKPSDPALASQAHTPEEMLTRPKPPNIFVIGHTHAPELLYIDIQDGAEAAAKLLSDAAQAYGEAQMQNPMMPF